MALDSVTIRNLTPTFGAEVSGIDLSKEMSATAQKTIKELWAEHQLLLFRGQTMGEIDLVRSSRYLGELEIHIRREYLSEENPEVLLVSNIKKDGRPVGILSDTEVGWHLRSDLSAAPSGGLDADGREVAIQQAGRRPLRI